MIRGVVTWGPAATWAAVLFLLSAVPDPGGAPWLPWSDKLAHFGLYAVLGAALAWGRAHGRGGPPHAALVLLGILYGASDEWHQSFVPGREPSAGDLAADTLGVLAGYLVSFLLLARRGERGASSSSATGR